MYENILKSKYDTKFGITSGPNISLFQSFQVK